MLDDSTQESCGVLVEAVRSAFLLRAGGRDNSGYDHRLWQKCHDRSWLGAGPHAVGVETLNTPMPSAWPLLVFLRLSVHLAFFILMLLCVLVRRASL